MRDATKAKVAAGTGIVGVAATYRAVGRSPKKVIARAALTGGAFAVANHYSQKDLTSHMSKAPVANKGRSMNKHPGGGM